MLAAFLWGTFEATLFFIVPDVLITWLAARQLRRAMVAAVFATGGAILGGLLMLAWGRQDPAAALSALDLVPAVNGPMLEQVRADLDRHGLAAMFAGPLLGVPYKIYAVQAGHLHLAAGSFLLVSIPARLIRFVLLALAVATVRRFWLPHWPQAQFAAILLAAWTTFYLGFFTLMPW